MTKAEKAQYLVNLLSIMERQNRLGAGNGSLLLSTEYQRNYNEFTSTIRKEQEDEARKSSDEVRAHENGASFKSGVAGSRLPDRL